MANTTNLNLVKPAGTDSALISDINGNMDKIDQYAGTTNMAISNLESQNAGTSANPITNLNDIPQNSRGITCLDSSVAPSEVSSSITLNYQKFGNSAGTSATILLSRPGDSKFWANFLASGTWQGWEEVAYKSDFSGLGTIAQYNFTVPKNGSKTITASAGHSVFLATTRYNHLTGQDGCWLIWIGSSSSNCVIKQLVGASDITVTSTLRDITFANASGTVDTSLTFVRIAGTATLT